MTVEERIGQLFLVTFEGDSVTDNSDIVELIRDYRVGGVVLLPQNDNLTGFGDPEETPRQVAGLTRYLQHLALEGRLPDAEVSDLPSATEPDTVPEEAIAQPGITLPLLIALSHDGSTYEENRVPGGWTALPSNMAIGATWEPAYAQAVGEIVGTELEATGINMLLGPALDVLESPAPANPADLGTTAFGGDPYWVGLMGQSYIEGVHAGGQGRVAVVAKHFPGRGSSDRPTNEEVPTVRKSLEQLKQIELAPFIAVTQGARSETAVTDALMATHIRYQGFQGNIRATTAPVSFDPLALKSLMALPEFAPWRQNGGVLVSDSLGVRSVKRFYDDTEQEFPHRVVAKDAFLAGNDLLYLSDFALGDAPYETQLANMKDTILWFREKYETDQSFQQRVDEAVLRILRLKLRLYEGDLSAENVLPGQVDLFTQVGNAGATVFDLAQAATTLIFPSAGELSERLASPPTASDRIVIFTDVREISQCTQCPEEAVISETALAERMLALYGPAASGQLVPSQVQSFSFADLASFLESRGEPVSSPTPLASATAPPDTTAEGIEGAEGTTPTPFATATPSPGFFVQEALSQADWIIFAMLDGGPLSSPLNRFLAERPDLLRGANVLVFAFDAPYYLDTTEITKLTAFYGIYSSIDVFLDSAARALFQEVPLSGAPPVSIDGIGYNLFQRTQPDPEQVIELYIVSGEEVQSPPSQEPLNAAVGDTLHLQTGVIRDLNGNPVPDGTIVQFFQRDRIQGTVNIIAETPTRDGRARFDYVLEARTGPGQFRITAASGNANLSQEVDISIEDRAQVAIIVPTNLPTPTPTETSTATPTAVPSATPTTPPTATVPVAAPPPEPGISIRLADLEMLLTMATGLAIVAIAALLLGPSESTASERAGRLLWALIGALALYIYYIMGLPGTLRLADLGNWAALATTLLGGLIGGAAFQTTRGDLRSAPGLRSQGTRRV